MIGCLNIVYTLYYGKVYSLRWEESHNTQGFSASSSRDSTCFNCNVRLSTTVNKIRGTNLKVINVYGIKWIRILSGTTESHVAKPIKLNCYPQRATYKKLQDIKICEVMLWFLVVIPLIVSSIHIAKVTSKTICVRPTDPPQIRCDCPSQADCHTLNEWIRAGSNPFMSDTSVVLLAGVHLINSTRNRILMEYVHSMALTHKNGNGATVTCVQHFSFEFFYSNRINISGIVFNSCVLRFSDINNCLLVNLTIINGRLMIEQTLRRSDEESKHYGTVDDEKRCESLDEFDIIGSTFQNSSINMKVESEVLNTPLYTTCTQLSLRGVVIKEFSTNSQESIAFFIIKAYNVILTNVTIHNSSGSGPLVTMSLVHKLTLRDVRFINNARYLLNLQGINTVRFEGDFIFKNNYGCYMTNLKLNDNTSSTIRERSRGIVLRQVKKIWTTSNSTLKFDKNCYDLNLFHFESDTELSSKFYLNRNTLVFEDNHVEGAVMQLDVVRLLALKSKVIFRKNINLQNERLASDPIPTAMLLILSSNCSFQQSTLTFSHNTAVLSGGITLIDSIIYFTTNTKILFEYNEGGDGGGMAFYEKSCIKRPQQPSEWYNETVDMQFYNNMAHGRGGAIFVKDSDYIQGLTGYQFDYFVSTPTFSSYSPKIHLHLAHNIAQVSGNDIYGGWIDHNRLKDIFLLSWIPAKNGDSQYAIASDPVRICICIDSIPVCNETEYPINVFPGQTFQIKAVAVGQRMGIVPSVVTAELGDDEGSLGEGQDVQGVNKECTALKFTIFSQKEKKTLELKVRDIGTQLLKNLYQKVDSLLTSQFSASVKLEKCPLGFLFKASSKTCSCLQSINSHSGVQCDYNTFSISKTKHKWLSATFEHTGNDNQHHGVIIYNQCPYDYCRTDPDPLSFHLEFPDAQCAFNRSGVLCGACRKNFSQVFGTSRCIECSNLLLLAVIPGILFAGIVLIAFLMLFNLTVSVGTINSLIFYANIIRASQAVFFPPNISTSFLSTFIAWLNLDLGIETCFCDGLGAYTKTWLQFVFPIYIWLMVIIIIVASHYSTTVSKLIPNNALQVLATLFLLSYVKVLRIVITVFSSTVLIYPDGFKKRVWLYDGNIEFFLGRHIPLCIATLLLLVLLSVPYTLSLISIQWLQKISHYRLLFWIHRLMPLFDAYTGPYKLKHRYWTGVLLMVRVIILIIFTLNQTNNPAVNLLTIIVVSFALLTYASYMRIYKNWLYNMLEIISLLNLGLLSATSFYQLLDEGGLVLTTSISISAAFITFIFILLLHATLQLMLIKKIRNTVSYLTNESRTKREQREEIDIRPIEVAQKDLTHTSIELYESLLDSEDKEH